MHIDRNAKIGIISGIISGIIASFLIIYLFDPIFRAMSFVLFSVLGSTARWYTDGLFADAALLVGPDPSLFILIILTGFGCGLFFSAIILALVWHPENADTPSHTWVPRISPRLGRAVIAAIAVTCILLLLLGFYSTEFELRITSSFNQHLAAVAPFISDQDVKVLRSRWTQMVSERDYTAINSDLEAIAMRNNITLPKNREY